MGEEKSRRWGCFDLGIILITLFVITLPTGEMWFHWGWMVGVWTLVFLLASVGYFSRSFLLGGLTFGIYLDRFFNQKSKKSELASFQLREIKPPQRCEVCHQSDQFDSTTGYCARCEYQIPTETLDQSPKTETPTDRPQTKTYRLFNQLLEVCFLLSFFSGVGIVIGMVPFMFFPKYFFAVWETTIYGYLFFGSMALLLVNIGKFFYPELAKQSSN